MIRSLGSSLLAKAGTGSLSRKAQETRLTKPEIPGKGAVGTAGRELVEQTDITRTAPGSQKIVRSAPGIESASLPGIAAHQVPLLAGMGSPGGAPVQMFQGRGLMAAGAPASQPGIAGRQASSIATMAAPRGQVAGARTERAAQAAAAQAAARGQVTPQAASVQAQRVPFSASELPNIGMFGGRVSADTGGQQTAQQSNQWQPTTAQYAVGGAGRALTNIGTALKAPQIVSGGLGAKMQTYGGSQSVAAAGRGSVEKAVQNISSALRSVTQKAQSAINKLRSKFRFRW